MTAGGLTLPGHWLFKPDFADINKISSNNDDSYSSRVVLFWLRPLYNPHRTNKRGESMFGCSVSRHLLPLRVQPAGEATNVQMTELWIRRQQVHSADWAARRSVCPPLHYFAACLQRRSHSGPLLHYEVLRGTSVFTHRGCADPNVTHVCTDAKHTHTHAGVHTSSVPPICQCHTPSSI